MSFLFSIGVGSPAEQSCCFYLFTPSTVCLLTSFSGSKYNVCINTNAYYIYFWGRNLGFRMNFNTFNGPLLTKSETQTPYNDMQSLWGSWWFSVLYSHLFHSNTGLQNPTQTLQPLKNTSWFFSLHIFCLCLRCLLCFYTRWIPNPLFLPNLKQITSLLRVPWHFLKVIFAPYLQYYTFWIYFRI